MPDNSDLNFTDARVFLKSADGAGDWTELSKVDNITIEPLTGDVLQWDFSKSDADLCFTAECTIDKRTRRKIKRMMKRAKPLKIEYRLMSSPWQRFRLWCIIHWAKLFHKPCAISTDTGEMFVCKDINEML